MSYSDFENSDFYNVIRIKYPSTVPRQLKKHGLDLAYDPCKKPYIIEEKVCYEKKECFVTPSVVTKMVCCETNTCSKKCDRCYKCSCTCQCNSDYVTWVSPGKNVCDDSTSDGCSKRNRCRRFDCRKCVVYYKSKRKCRRKKKSYCDDSSSSDDDDVHIQDTSRYVSEKKLPRDFDFSTRTSITFSDDKYYYEDSIDFKRGLRNFRHNCPDNRCNV